MIYNIWFNVCAIILLSALMVQYFMRKAVSFVQNTLYLYMIIFMWYASFFSLFAIILEGKNYFLVAFFNYAVIVFDCLVGSMWLVYILSLINYKDFRKLSFFTITTPLIFMVILLSLNGLIDDFIFTIDPVKKSYIAGRYIFLLYILVYFHYVAVIVNVFIANRRFFSKEIKRLVPFMLVIGIAGFLIELFFPQFVVRQFIMSVLLLLLYYSLQSPEEYFDEETGLMNELGFSAICSKRMVSTKTPLKCIAICVHDMESVINFMGTERKEHMERRAMKEFSSLLKGCRVFKFDDGKYLIVIDSSKDEVSRQALLVAVKGLKRMKISSSACLFECPKYASSLEGIRQILECVLNYGMERSLEIVNVEDLNLHQEKYVNSLEKLVRTAVEENRLEVYYQPVYSVFEKRFVSAEALLRLINDDGEIIEPDLFIPIAERSGVITEMGEFVFNEICRTYTENELEKYGIKTISMNVSTVELMQSNLVSEKIKPAFDKYNVKPESVCFEIKEQSIISSDRTLSKNIESFSEMGINLSLDGFGTGQYSLMRILELPFNAIKIDKSIVMPAFLSGNRNARILLESTIDMVRRLGSKIIVEGIESDAAASGVTVLGCDCVQGFFYAKPMPKKAFLSMLMNR